MLAEKIWWKEIGLGVNRAICSDSLPRKQSLVSEAKSKLKRSIESDLESVEIEVRDFLERPLTAAEITISSPSLFGETTSSSQSSPPQVTVELRDLRKI